MMSLQTVDAVNSAKCQWCGMIHGASCPRVSAIEYHPNGTVKRVEFHAPVFGGVADQPATSRAVHHHYSQPLRLKQPKQDRYPRGY